MLNETAIEARLAALEKKVAELENCAASNGTGNWLNKISGSMKDNPAFDEAMRLAAEIRRADRLPEDP